MRTRSIITLVVSSAALLLASANTAGAGTGVESAARSESTDKSQPKTGKPMLEKGMTAETVLQLVGKPREISPIASPEGKAEMWTYRRNLDTKHVLDATRVETIPTFAWASMDGGIMGTAVQPVYSMKHITIDQVTALLMFEGKLVIARQWQEQSRSYDN